MAVYLVDYENVSCNGLNGLESLTSADSVHIFYSTNANKITFEIHHQIISSPASFHYYNVNVGKKNALDFQLSTYLGYLIASNAEEEYIIISNDETFSCLIKFWLNKQIDVKVACNLLKEEPINTTKVLRDTILKALPEHKNDVEVIIKYVQEYKTKQKVNNALVKKFQSERAGRIYKVVKPFLS